jgi:hypothetical protein
VERRDFLAAAAVAAAAPIPTLDGLVQPQAAARQFIELRRYHLLPGAKQRAFTSFIGDTMIPALNRAGIVRVGALEMVYGENAPTLLLVLAHPTLDSVVTLRERLAGDSAYTRAGASMLDTPMSDPAFVRMESTLLRAFEAMPALEAPTGGAAARSRIFELRTYESHSDRAAMNKLQMFNAGEIPIFRRAGLTPVFFGETVIGAKMPSLTYMLAIPDMAARDSSWSAFGKDPDWKKLSGDPQYQDNVSAISDIILRPTSFSQL